MGHSISQHSSWCYRNLDRVVSHKVQEQRRNQRASVSPVYRHQFRARRWPEAGNVSGQQCFWEQTYSLSRSRAVLSAGHYIESMQTKQETLRCFNVVTRHSEKVDKTINFSLENVAAVWLKITLQHMSINCCHFKTICPKLEFLFLRKDCLPQLTSHLVLTCSNRVSGGRD